MKKILLILIGLSGFLNADFTKSGNIVTDSITGLQWSDISMSHLPAWAGAIEYCEELTLDGYDDWRLPNKNELLSIVDYSRYEPAISKAFKITAYHITQHYWTSTSRVHNTSSAWVIRFRSGTVHSLKKINNAGYVRCVRTAD
ncbi:MAG: DUF1566 domain-containing protein [Campylobacterales bacterium]|nr:DUF1566 domain-containing protein [Campylobacterales bacterium]